MKLSLLSNDDEQDEINWCTKISLRTVCHEILFLHAMSRLLHARKTDYRQYENCFSTYSVRSFDAVFNNTSLAFFCPLPSYHLSDSNTTKKRKQFHIYKLNGWAEKWMTSTRLIRQSHFMADKKMETLLLWHCNATT